jgi:hypothetical protein
MLQGDRYEGPGLIKQGKHEVSVTCRYEVMRVDGIAEWHGEFDSAPIGAEPTPGAARLLAGGKSGAIEVVAVGVGTGRGRFQGSGSPPA